MEYNKRIYYDINIWLYHRCSVDLERLSLPQDQFCSVLRKVQQLTQCEDVLFFSTCNRTELVIGSSSDIPKKVLLNWLSAHCNIEMPILEKHHYLYTKEKAIHHLLRVCSGLDSKLVGETQVFGQFKTAYTIAKDAGTLEGSMDWILQEVFSIAKAIRHTTKISHNSESMGYAIKKLSNQTTKHSSFKPLFIGTGEIISVAIDYLTKEPLSPSLSQAAPYNERLNLQNHIREKAFVFKMFQTQLNMQILSLAPQQVNYLLLVKG